MFFFLSEYYYEETIQRDDNIQSNKQKKIQGSFHWWLGQKNMRTISKEKQN